MGVCSVVVFGGFDQIERILAEYELDTVFHLAAQTQVSTAVAEPIGTLTANIEGTWKVLDASRRQKVRRVVVASSDKVYGDGPVPYVEEQALAPRGVYATSKACGDFLAQAYTSEYGLSVAITRCGNLYGPGHFNWSTLIPGTIRAILERETIKLRSNGSPRRDYLYVQDAVDGYIKLAMSDVRGAFNFGTGRASSVHHVVDTIRRLMKSSAVVSDCDGSVEAIEIQDQFLSYAKAERLLGWHPSYTLEQGLEKTIASYRDYFHRGSQ
jgi:CDP-glucose 4,6-dehydratase